MNLSGHYCWLTHCRSVGAELVAGNHRIVLCVAHRAELESTADYGYSLADPPVCGGRSVGAWQDLEISTWWPWELVDDQ